MQLISALSLKELTRLQVASEDLYRELDGEHEAPMSTPNMPPLREGRARGCAGT